MPPERDVYFFFDLEPRTRPFYIPLYDMAAVKLRELKDQMQEILNKDVIHSNDSP